MSNDLISRSDLKKRLQARFDYGYEDFDKGYNIGIKAAIDLIDTAPTVDAIVNTIEERPTGEWINELSGTFNCSICGCKHSNANFCPNCGAYMRVKDEIKEKENDKN